jgi:conjugal transfer pilus assembly protein TraV
MNPKHPTPWRLSKLLSLATVSLALQGCMNLSGLDGGTRYACKAPDGVACDSVSGTYANAIHDNLPSQRGKRTGAAPQPKTLRTSPAQTTRAAAQQPIQAAPLRSDARILRLWVKAWEDSDLDLHDQGFVYVQIDAGQWLIERAQRQVRDAYAPLRPPVQRSSKATGGSPPDPDTRPLRPGPGTAPSTEGEALLPPLDVPVLPAQ